MPGLPKRKIATLIQSWLETQGVDIKDSAFVGTAGDLPWACEIIFESRFTRKFSLYFWTIGHGGRTRSQTEYRVQTKLKKERKLHIGNGTSLLLGYYNESLDIVGKDLGNRPPQGMEVLVAWDPIYHLRVGESSSCQVSFDLLYRSYLSGVSGFVRQLADGNNEQVIGFRSEYLANYLRLSVLGHRRVQIEALRRRGPSAGL
jgi:hypothetical protein